MTDTQASQISDSAFKQLIGRLRNTNIKPSWQNFRYRLFGHTNPQANKGWIYKRFVESKKENYRLIIAPTSNNIYLPEHYLESMKEDFDPEYYRINVLGQFGNYSSGLVVKNFTDENIKNLQYNDTLPLHLTCDFNVDPILRLNVGDVRNRTHIQITEQKTGKFKKFPINSKLKPMIDDFIKGRRNTEPLFLSVWNHRLDRTTSYYIIRTACEKAGLEERVGTHTMRKTFGYHHYQQFKDVVLLQKIFNHSSPQITLRYIGVEQDEIDDSYKNFVL